MPTLQRQCRPSNRRGVALVLVLSVVAATSILAWAMLAASNARSQIDANTLDTVDAASLAESGASYAMHCLHYPDLVRPTGADAATWFYPGQTNLPMWSDARGTVDLVVTSTGADTRKIKSTAVIIRPGESTGSKHTVEADVTCIYQGILQAAGFNGGMTVPNNVKIYGAVTGKGAIVSSQSGFNNSTSVVGTGSNTVPASTEVVLLNETGVTSTASGASSNDRTYTYNGNTYIAEKAPATITALGLTTLRPSLNPCNVWYSNSNVLLNGASFNGTLVIRGTSTLTASGTSTLKSSATGMPAAVIEKKLELKSSSSVPAKLTITGAAWIGDKIQATSPDRSDAMLKIDGSLLMADPSPAFNLAAAVTVTYDNSVAAITKLGTIKTIASLKVTSYKSVD